MQRLEDDLLWSRDQVRRLEQLVESANDVLSQDIGELELDLGLNPADSSLRESFSESIDRNGSMKGESWILTLRVSTCITSCNHLVPQKLLKQLIFSRHKNRDYNHDCSPKKASTLWCHAFPAFHST